MHWSEINGAIMRHCRQGRGAPVLLIHEMGGSLHSYDRLAPMLEDDFTVLRHDLRGAGMSEKVSGRLDPEVLVSDMLELLARETAEPAILVGAAVGAGLALLAALRAPEQVRGVIGLSPVTHCLPENRTAVLGHAGRLETEGLRVLEPTSIPAILPPVLRDDARAFEDARGRWLANDPQSFAAIYRMMAHLDLRPELGKLARPCLMVGARHDGFCPPAAIRALAESLPDGRFVEIESGHVAAAQTPELIAGIIRSFAGELPA